MREEGGAHFTYNLAQQEIVQLAENEENGAEGVVPHRSDLVQDGEDYV